MIRSPKTINQYEHYKKKNGLVVVKFGAEWCGPCKRIMPFIKKLAEEYQDSYFVDVNVDTEIGDHEDATGFKTIPHFKFYVDGKLVREVSGTDKENIERYVKRYSKNSN